MSKIVDLNDLFVDLLRDIYYAEKKILKALPKMSKALGDDETELAEAFDHHCEETEGQVERLEQAFKILGERPKAKKCDAIEGLVTEADDIMAHAKCPATMAAGLLAGAQAVEHYEIARYGTLIEWAKLLGHEDIAELLEETLEQEKNADQTLNDLAINEVNERALESASAEDEDEDDEEEDNEEQQQRQIKRGSGRRYAA